MPRLTKAKPILIEIGPGELIDKITILKIKNERIGSAEKQRNVRHELETLENARRDNLPDSEELSKLEANLKTINERLWEIEDEIRNCEANQDFGTQFIELARSVYKQNDHRAALKKEINILTGSSMIEEKSYSQYG